MKGITVSEIFETLSIHLYNDTFTGVPRTFEMTFDEFTDVENAAYVLTGKVNAGWEIAAVHVETDWQTDVVGTKSVDEIMDLLSALQDEPNDITRILAYGEHFSWSAFGIERFGNRGYEDVSCWTGDSRTDVVGKYHEWPELDGYLSIDWEQVAHDMDCDLRLCAPGWRNSDVRSPLISAL